MTTSDRLTLYVNPAWRREGIHSVLMNLQWGNPYGESSIFAKQMFDSYAPDTECYTITDDIKTANMVLTPYPHVWFLRHDTKLFDECVKTARDAGLPLLVDGTGDIEHPVNIKNAFVLRYGGYRFINENGRIQVPMFADDLLERIRGGQLDVRKKAQSKPIIGFAGWVNLSIAQYIKTIIKELPMRIYSIFDERYRACAKGVLWRQRAIKILQKSPLVTLNLLTRKSFSGSSKTADGNMQELQRQMVDTILNSDYALDVKGDANASTRLFEILSLGRIPVIVDTERNFPFKDKVDYSSFALIVDFRDIKKLPEIIAEFHKNVSSEQFEEMQRNARNAYVNYFRIDAVMSYLVGELRQAKSI